MINYRLVIAEIILNVGVNSYARLQRRICTGIRVLTLNILATTDNFMSVDHKAFKIAVWEALDGTKLFFSSCAMFPSSLSAEINFGKYDPLLWWRNHESYVPTIAKPASMYLCIFCLGIFLKTKRLRRGGVASCMEGCIGKCIFLRQNSN